MSVNLHRPLGALSTAKNMHAPLGTNLHSLSALFPNSPAGISTLPVLLGSRNPSVLIAGYVYFTASEGTGNQQIQRIKTDGTEYAPMTGFTTGFPFFAVDSTNSLIYFCVNGSGIYSIPIGGSTATLIISTTDNVFDLAIDVTNGYMFWGQSPSGELSSDIRRADLADGDNNTLLDNKASRRIVLDPANQRLFYGTGTIRRINYDGTGGGTVATSGSSGPDLEYSGGKIYYAVSGSSLKRVNADGTSDEVIVSPYDSGLGDFQGFRIGGSKIFSFHDTTITSYDLDGTNAATVSSGFTKINELVVDGANQMLYVFDRAIDGTPNEYDQWVFASIEFGGSNLTQLMRT